MANTSAYPITVDGVRLDTLAYNVLAVRPQVAGVRTSDLVVPGQDGTLASLWDAGEPATFGLQMLVRGTDVDGLVPVGGDSIATLEANLDELEHLFRGSPHRLLDVRRTVDAAGTVRQAFAKVVDVISPDLKAGAVGEFSVGLVIPSGTWQDLATADTTLTATSGTGTGPLPIPALDGATAPSHHAVFVVTGPAANPTLTDASTGAYVRLNSTLAAGETWRVNAGTWSTRTAPAGSPLGLGSADTTGTDATALTQSGGGSARYLSLVPQRASAADRTRRVRLTLSGTGMTAGTTTVQTRTRRRFLA